MEKKIDIIHMKSKNLTSKRETTEAAIIEKASPALKVGPPH